MQNQKITRTEVALWYGITERALRYRMNNKNIQIANRILTECDIRLILKRLDKPFYMPPDLYAFIFGS